LKPKGDSFLVDWEATTGYWPIPFVTFKALGSNSSVNVRVTATLSDYYNYGYEDDQFLSIQMQHISGGTIYGYIDRNHPDTERLVGQLYDGRSHRIILQIFPMRGKTSNVLISSFVADSWVISAS
jgi:hypothetical protein